MAISKIRLNGITKMDVTGTTAEISDVAYGKNFTLANGNEVVGSSTNIIYKEAPIKDIELIDYDGFTLYSYTKTEFLALTSLPIPWRNHPNLTFYGWNWTLADAKNYVTKYGEHVIGALYTTTNGKTYIHLDHKKLTTVTIYIDAIANSSYEIDWDDGNIETITINSETTITHDYLTTGDYWVKINVLSGTLSFIGINNVNGFITPSYELIEVNAGNNTIFNNNSLHKLIALERVSISPYQNKTIVKLIGSDCNCIKGIVSSYGYASYACWGKGLRIASFPKSTDNLNASFDYCPGLRRIIIPEGCTNIDSNGPRGCNSVTRMKIPDTVTNMYQNVFNDMYNCNEYHFYSTTPPVRGGSGGAFSNMPADTVIYVPKSANQTVLNNYKTATNWINMASYMQEEP